MSEDVGEGASITLRDTGRDDDPFLFKLYASTREDEMAAWGWGVAQAEMFLRLQFQAWQRGLLVDGSKTTDRIILRNGEPIGRLVVIRSSSEICLADIALLPQSSRRRDWRYVNPRAAGGGDKCGPVVTSSCRPRQSCCPTLPSTGLRCYRR